MVETANEMRLSQTPVVNVGMMIRRPVEEVFAAFIDPEITSKFWFTRGSAPLAPGAQVRWDWAMYGAGADVRVTAFEEYRRIEIEWGSADEDAWTTVEWTFDSRPEGGTMVNVVNRGFQGSGDEISAAAMDSSQGFAFTLAAAKAWLEHGIELNVVADHFPDAHVEGWQPSGSRLADAIEREVFIGAGIEYVWSLVSNVGFWIGEELRFDKQAAEGELVTVATEQYGEFPVRVDRLDPPRYAAYRWASAFPGATPTAENSTLVEFSLVEREGGVLVQLKESGFAGLAGGEDVRLRAFSNNEAGWDKQLERLREAAEGVAKT